MAVERLGEGAGRVAPAALEDRSPDPIALLLPAFHAIRIRSEGAGQLDRAVERHPAHELGVEEVAGLVADLPDPVIRLLPSGGRGIGDIGQKLRDRWRQLLHLVPQPVRRSQKLAVDVELPLVPGAIAHSTGRLPRQPAR